MKIKLTEKLPYILLIIVIINTSLMYLIPYDFKRQIMSILEYSDYYSLNYNNISLKIFELIQNFPKYAFCLSVILFIIYLYLIIKKRKNYSIFGKIAIVIGITIILIILTLFVIQIGMIYLYVLAGGGD